jgi:hypothetical protein
MGACAFVAPAPEQLLTTPLPPDPSAEGPVQKRRDVS